MKPSRSPGTIGYFPEAPAQRRETAHAGSHARASYRSTPARPRARKRGRVLHRGLLLVCACVFLFSTFSLIRYFANIAVTKKASRQLEEVYEAAVESEEPMMPTAVPTAPPARATNAPEAAALPETTVLPEATVLPSAETLWPSSYPDNPGLRVSSVFYELQRQNADIIGWLKIEGVLEEAVCQRDNSYYLTHNALRQKSVTGALFLDESCNLKTVPTQMVIHGHNMKEGTMFGSLMKYKTRDVSFYCAHPFIDFNTIYENGRYVIFAVSEVDVRKDRADYLPFWEDVRFASAEAFEEYVRRAKALSRYRCNVDVKPGDRLLTLSTCTGSDEHKRLLVMARRIRDGEDELALNMAIYSTDDR